MNITKKVELQKSLQEHIPERMWDVVFGSVSRTSAFDRLWQAMSLHFGEIELIARREYERGYKDGKAGKEF